MNLGDVMNTLFQIHGLFPFRDEFPIMLVGNMAFIMSFMAENHPFLARFHLLILILYVWSRSTLRLRLLYLDTVLLQKRLAAAKTSEKIALLRPCFPTTRDGMGFVYTLSSGSGAI